MYLSFLYAILIALIVVEVAIVAWTVNFVRKYAFRPNPEFADDPGAPEWPPGVPKWQRIAFARTAHNDQTSARPDHGARRQARFGHSR